jgi:hypothetical protein
VVVRLFVISEGKVMDKQIHIMRSFGTILYTLKKLVADATMQRSWVISVPKEKA